MAFNAAAKATSALKLLQKFGANVTLSHVADTVADAARPWEVADNDTDETVTAVQVAYESREIDGTVILHQDRRYIIAASGMTSAPVPDDKLVDGDEFRVINVETLAPKPGAADIIYTVQVRK